MNISFTLTASTIAITNPGICKIAATLQILEIQGRKSNQQIWNFGKLVTLTQLSTKHTKLLTCYADFYLSSWQPLEEIRDKKSQSKKLPQSDYLLTSLWRNFLD